MCVCCPARATLFLDEDLTSCDAPVLQSAFFFFGHSVHSCRSHLAGVTWFFFWGGGRGSQVEIAIGIVLSRPPLRHLVPAPDPTPFAASDHGRVLVVVLLVAAIVIIFATVTSTSSTTFPSEGRRGVGPGGELGCRRRRARADLVVEIDPAERKQDAFDVCFPPKGGRGQWG